VQTTYNLQQIGANTPPQPVRPSAAAAGRVVQYLIIFSGLTLMLQVSVDSGEPLPGSNGGHKSHEYKIVNVEQPSTEGSRETYITVEQKVHIPFQHL
jgi:hypothetical protein